ncbi:formylmethanofuran dehydrogenase subunit C [Methylocystis sp. IM3]|uniref:formylmethanofuran dehydrogenase subunit C n=1 Tax=unclassified Methylocystis TaxID=2625913 RepID=UPI0030FCC929
MKPFTFTLRQEPPQRVDLSALTPDRLAGKSLAAIEKIELGTTRASTKVGDLFKLAEGDLKNVRYEGGSARFDRLGAKLLPGFSIHVEGDVGLELGRLAKGGAITVSGGAGAYAASGNEGAHIEIRGDAGEMLAAPLAGELAGMSGGRVVVRGKVGARAGDRLRRGILIIEGDAGDDLGSRFIAGTIIALGKTSGRVGYLNKRGSIILARRPEIPPTYVDCGPHVFTFAGLFARGLKADSAAASALLSQRLQRFGGDTAVYGKGEILTPA